MAHRALPTRRAYHARLLRAWGVAVALVFVSLGIGVVGYHLTEHMPWIDALLCAAMILTGMGPTAPIVTVGGKLFASAYALFSGVMFLTIASLLMAPVFHRFLHRFHLELEDKD